MSMSRLILWGGLFGLLIAGCMGARTVARTDKEEDEEPGKASLSEIQQVSGSDQQPFLVRLETSKGDIVIEVHPEWAPRGARRFRELTLLRVGKRASLHTFLPCRLRAAGAAGFRACTPIRRPGPRLFQAS